MGRGRVAAAKPDCPRVDELGCRLVQIDLETPGADVVMESCSACDQRWWTVAGRETDLDGALRQLATTGRRR